MPKNKKSNFVTYAETELEKIGAFSEEDDFYHGETGKAVMELINVFDRQGHSGMSASLVASLFNKLVNYKPLSPLTGENDEWMEESNGTRQNKRCFSLFQEQNNLIPYYCDAIVWVDPSGSGFTGMVDGISSCCYIKEFPFIPKTFRVHVVKNDANTEWRIKDMEELVPVYNYYRSSVEK